MTQEEKKQLEDKAQALRTTADQAHQAAADAPGDEALQEAADKAEEAAGQAQAEADAATVDPAPKPKVEGEEEEDEEDIDFEEELKNLQPPAPPAPDSKKELEKAEKSLFFNAQQVKKLGGDPSKVLAGEAPIAPKPVEGAEFVSREDFVETEFAKIAKSEAERKVLMHHYKYSIQKTGNLAADMENAYILANKGKIQRSFSEIRRGALARPAPGSPPGRRAPAAQAVPALTADEQNTLKRRGYKQQPDGSWKGKRYIQRFVQDKGWIQEKIQ